MNASKRGRMRRRPLAAAALVVVMAACTATNQGEPDAETTAPSATTTRPSRACPTTSPATSDGTGTSPSMESTDVPEVEVWVEPAVDQVGDDLDVAIDDLVRGDHPAGTTRGFVGVVGQPRLVRGPVTPGLIDVLAEEAPHEPALLHVHDVTEQLQRAPARRHQGPALDVGR